MSRKYEIVNVGGVKRVRALRSWVVQGRQVNVGDVGGVVFDERTLSQDGDSWIFSGRFDNALVRVGGDSVVNIGDVVPARFPFINIFGTSSLDANFNVNFGTALVTGAQALTPAMMERGDYAGTVGNLITKISSANSVRKTEKVFTGGAAFALPAPAAGYQVKAIAVDAEGYVVYSTGYVTAASNIPAGAHAYAYIVVGKSPAAATVPADVTAAALTFTNSSAATLNIVDSHVTLTGQQAGYVTLDPSVNNGDNTTNIIGSTVQVNRTAGTPKLILACDLINTNARIDMQTTNISVLGSYRNVKSLVWSGITRASLTELRNIVQATDCDNFVMDGVNINTSAIDAANAIGTPYKFIRCNMNKARIVNQPLIKNTYEDINFDLASADLGKTTALSITHLVSSNVNGMYRLREGAGGIGALVESHESVKDLNLVSAPNATKTYNTTIYADAYLKGAMVFEGTHIFGGSRSHGARTFDASHLAVPGIVNAISVGGTITGVTANPNRVCIPVPVKLRTAKGLTIQGLSNGLQVAIYCTNASSVISNVIGWGGDRDLTGVTGAEQLQCYVAFHYDNNAAIKPEDLAGVTIETYNGCKIVNTKTETMTIKGNVRVEDNAVLKDTSIEGTGYFGGDSVMETSTAATVPQPIKGYAFMKDNAVFSPSSFSSSSSGSCITRLHMQGNARMTGAVASANVNLVMKDNAEYNGLLYGICDITLEDRAIIPASLGVTAASYGKFTMKGRASLGANITIKGDITLCDNFRNTAAKTYSGKRVYASQDAPQYDDNVKTKYDF